jgi:hypothetical protein
MGSTSGDRVLCSLYWGIAAFNQLLLYIKNALVVARSLAQVLAASRKHGSGADHRGRLLYAVGTAALDQMASEEPSIRLTR